MTAEDLSGVRLIARRDLAAALGAVARAPAPPADRPAESAAIPQPPAPAATPEPAAEQAPARPPIKLAPAKTPLATRAGQSASAPDETPDEPTDEPMDEEAAPALAMVDLPPAVDKALNGATLPSKGIEARRSGGAPGADSQGPGRAGNGHHTPPPAPASAPAQGHADGLLTPEELNALLGDDS